jgi:hypothetical protein
MLRIREPPVREGIRREQVADLVVIVATRANEKIPAARIASTRLRARAASARSNGRTQRSPQCGARNASARSSAMPAA